MSFIMSYTDNGGTVHPDSFWVLHRIETDRINRYALLIFHGWHQWEDYPDQTKIIGERSYNITDPEQYEITGANGDKSGLTPFYTSLENGILNWDDFLMGVHYADTPLLDLSINYPTGFQLDLHGPDALLVQFIDEIDLPSDSPARGLVASWKLDETTGTTRADALGRSANDLTDHNNVVRNASGKVGAGTQFTAASSQYLSCPVNDDLKITATGTHIISCWVKFTTLGVGAPIFTRDAGGDAPSYRLFLSVTPGTENFFEFRVGNTDSPDTAFVIGYNAGAVTTGVWYFVACVYRSENREAFLYVNNGVRDFDTLGVDPVDDGADFLVGTEYSLSVFLNGQVDAINKHYFTDQLSDGELAALISSLYNSGAGWEPDDSNDWRAGVTLSVNGSPVTIASATSSIGSAVVWYKVATPFAANDVVTWKYDATTGLIQNVPASYPVWPVSETAVDNQVGESLDFSDPANSGHLLQLLG